MVRRAVRRMYLYKPAVGFLSFPRSTPVKRAVMTFPTELQISTRFFREDWIFYLQTVRRTGIVSNFSSKLSDATVAF